VDRMRIMAMARMTLTSAQGLPLSVYVWTCPKVPDDCLLRLTVPDLHESPGMEMSLRKTLTTDRGIQKHRPEGKACGY
jgi:hypothetical protein